MPLYRQGRPTRPILITLGCLFLAAAFAVGLQASERGGSQARLYAYTVLDGPASPACGFDYIDLGADALPVALHPGADGANVDDGAAIMRLAEPFELYQTPVQSLVISGNGYLAAAGGFGQDDGADYSNDCGLPVRADNSAASNNRIYVYHDDLRPQHGGQVRQRHFPVCPRASAHGPTEACTVVEWNGFERVEPIPSSRPLRMQAVLYHRSQAIALQYDSVDDSQAGQATIGLQGFDGRAATQASCNQRGRVAARRAVCFFDPRHAPGATSAARPGPAVAATPQASAASSS